jgi:copper(I)-binding protein
MPLLLAVGLAALIATAPVMGTQPTVKASAAWIQAPTDGGTEATAFVTIDNATMYDVYIVGAETEAAEVIELRETPKGAAAPVSIKEVPVAAYGRLEMSSNAVHLHLRSLRRPLAAGDSVDLVIHTDGGEQLRIAATVK